MAALMAGACFAGTSGDAKLADAAMNQDAQAVQSLLKLHADVNAPQADGTTALHWAARWNDVEMTDLLLAAGANVKARNRFGFGVHQRQRGDYREAAQGG